MSGYGGYSIDNDPWLSVFNVAEKRYFRDRRAMIPRGRR